MGMAEDTVTLEPEQTEATPDRPFLDVKSNQQLNADAMERQTKKLLNDEEYNSRLASLIEERFQRAVTAKDAQTDILMDQLRRRKGVYSASRMAEIKRQGGSDIWMKLTEIKCNAADAWIADIITPVEEKPWSLSPTPVPELPSDLVDEIANRTIADLEANDFQFNEEEIAEIAVKYRDEMFAQADEAAQKRAKRMDEEIDDQFTEGELAEALEEGISDLTTFGTMIIKGPFLRFKKKLQWDDKNNFAPIVSDELTMQFKAIDPLKFFPSAGATTPNDAVYTCEVDEFTRKALSNMKGMPNYSDTRIDKLLRENRKGVTVPLKTNSEQSDLEDRDSSTDLENPDANYQGVWHCGEMEGYVLKEWGLSGVQENESYEIVALKIGGEVIHCHLNPDPLGRRDYVKAVYKPVKGSFWGEGIPLLMKDMQDACNSTARHLINNLAVGSGPQVVVSDIDALAEGEDITAMYPWKIWQFNDPMRTGKSPVSFDQPQVYARELMEVFKFWMDLADEETGIPKYEYGQASTKGAGATASGLAMLMNSSSRVLKKSIQNVDKRIFKPLIEKAFVWNMLYNDDQSIKGDVQIETQGAMGIFVKEQRQLRLSEFTQNTANPDDRQILGLKGRARLLRENAKGLDIPIDELLPSELEIEQMEEAMRRQAQMAQMEQGGVPGGVPAGQ